MSGNKQIMTQIDELKEQDWEDSLNSASCCQLIAILDSN